MEGTHEYEGVTITHSLENVSRRSRKLKNLEKEVELILSQDESEEEKEIVEKDDLVPLPKTPSTKKSTRKTIACTPQASDSVLQDMLQTPRRSCRKSIKPPQDYDDIVRHTTRRSARKKLNSLDENNEEDENEHSEEHIKWSAASVGRSSTKRGRKSRRNTTTNRGRRNLNESAMEEPAHVTSQSEEIDEAAVLDNKKNEKGDLFVSKEVVQTVHDDVEKNEHSSENVEVDGKKEVKEEEHEVFIIKEENDGQVNEQPAEDINLHQKENADIGDFQGQLKEEEQPEDEIHLIQDDDEEEIKEELIEEKVTAVEVKEENDLATQADEQKDISMISIKEESSNDVKEEKLDEEENDSFGSYLKSKEIDIDDLGLNPINDDEEETDVVFVKQESEEKKEITPTEQPEDMPSLIVCDDEEEEEEANNVSIENQEDVKHKLNETFDAEESVVIVANDEPITSVMEMDTIQNDVKAPEESISVEPTEMDKLQMSEDEEEEEGPAKKRSKVMFISPIPSSPSTPKSKMVVRHLTPYRTKSDSKPKREQLHDSGRKLPLNKENLNFSTSELTTMTPRDIVLRGIRKRSLSVCLGTAAPKLTRSAKKAQQKAVNFYSPANQTAIIEDLDKLILKNVKQNMQKGDEENKNKNVTTRRKRSYSFDDSTMSKSICVTSRLPRPMANQKQFLNSTTTSSSSSSTSSLSTSMIKPKRTKLPNFAAIHQKQFQKMENLADHVARKQERSKILINSNSKIRPASAQKNIVASMKSNNNTAEKPKALKRIDMTSSQSQTQTKSANTSISVAKKVAMPNNNNQNKNPTEPTTTTTSSNLPDPRDAKLIATKSKATATAAAMLPKKHLQPTQTFNVSTNMSSSLNLKQKPVFNLSTQVGGSNTSSRLAAANTSITQRKPTAAAGLTNQDKMASRLQRHIDMFKGRVPAARAGVASRKNEAAIKGVRSNRRFELQMQHRKNIEN
ncbi:mitotic spindle and nuclear protein [Musca autumnalis]|uniref:mitotic spindle and nuclear protein n=1 Tax=Musca autumnalis TaxID=221902 RepID=UPI003CF43666